MSTTTVNIAMPQSMRLYVAERVASGDYGNTSEYVRELIRKDQQELARRHLASLMEEGLASGPARADTEDDWAELERIARGGKAR